MKCFFHPTEDALYDCSICERPICGQCMRFDEDDRVICPACTLEKAVDLADEDVHERMTARHEMMAPPPPDAVTVTRKRLFNGWLLALLVAMIIGQVLLRQYIARANPPPFFDVARFRQLGEVGIEFSYVLAKVLQFANDHAGQLPESPEVLYPGYLEAVPAVLGTEQSYIYTMVQGAEQFVLNVQAPGPYGYPRLYATGDGIMRTQ